MKIDVILNSAMRIITGTLKSTPLQWLPALSHIAPLGVCRHEITREELHRTFTYPDLPIHEDLGNQPNWTSANFLEEFDVNGEWRKTWVESDFPNQDLVHVRANRPRPPKKAMGESEQDDSTPCKVSQSSPSMENERQPCMWLWESRPDSTARGIWLPSPMFPW